MTTTIDTSIPKNTSGNIDDRRWVDRVDRCMNGQEQRSQCGHRSAPAQVVNDRVPDVGWQWKPTGSPFTADLDLALGPVNVVET
jgi:hypothetical protein